MKPVEIKDICNDIHFLNTTKLKQWQNPHEGDTCNTKILNNTKVEGKTERLYRCYTFLSGEWCYQGVFKGIDRFARNGRIDCNS